MRVPTNWTEHRRADGELLGWLVATAAGTVAVDLLGRPRTETVTPTAAATTLEDLGLGYLAEPYELLINAQWEQVRIVEVSTRGIVLKAEDWGAIGAPIVRYELPFPAPETLRARA